MEILRMRRGFQADHSSSSYLFYAADKPVSEQGRRIARRYSSRADVGKHSVRFLKWGETSLSESAYKVLLAEHYDVMVSESYDWWTFMIAISQTAKTKLLPTRYSDARGYDDLGVDVEKFGSRWAICIYCVLDYNELAPDHDDDDPFEYLVKLLVRIRKEIMEGDFSLLDAVTKFYASDEEQPCEEELTSPAWRDQSLTKAQLQAECQRRGIDVRKSWSKDQLRAALDKTLSRARQRPNKRLSAAGQKLMDCLDRV